MAAPAAANRARLDALHGVDAESCATNLGRAEMSEIIFIVEEAPEGGFTAGALDASIFTEADTVPKLRDAIRDAVQCHFEPDKAPKIIRLHFVRDEVLTA
jgi:hypothetical protein